MLTARKVRFWYRVHKWTSLICTAVLLLSCITGLPMIFGDEIYDLTHHMQHPANLPPDAPLARLDRIVATAKQMYPGEKVRFVGWDDDEPRIFVRMISSYDPRHDGGHNLDFDAHTGELLVDRLRDPAFQHNLSDQLMEIVSALHTSLYARLPGELFLGGMAVLFVIALASGALVYGPFMRRLDFGTVRTGKSTRLKWFDLHNLLGIVSLTWAFVVGATGVMNTLAEPLFNLWSSHTMPALLAPYRGQPLPAAFTSIDVAVSKAHEVLPGMKPVTVVFPNPVDNRPRDYIVWMKGDTPITSRLFTPVLIDAGTGQLMAAKGLPWYLRALEVSRPLHFGDYGGLLLKIIWAIFDLMLIAVLVSGIYLWFSRRKSPIEGELDRLVKLEGRSTNNPAGGA